MSKKMYFFNPFKVFAIVAVLSVLGTLLMSYSQAPPPSKTGAPGESSCIFCHNSGSNDYTGNLVLEGLPDVILPNETYQLTIKGVSTGTDNPALAGFELVALDTAGLASVGALSATMTTSHVESTAMPARSYLAHSGTQDFSNDEVSWTFEWTAPAELTMVTFYAASVFANGTGGTSNDLVVLFADTIPMQNPPEMIATIDEVVNPICHEGTGAAHVSVTNGAEPFTYLWSNDKTTPAVDQLFLQKYYVTVTDANGGTAVDSVTIEAPGPIIGDIVSSTDMIPCGDSVVLKASAFGGTGELTFAWIDGPPTDSIVVTEEGYYCVVITDENGCTGIKCQSMNADLNSIFCNGISADTITCQYPSRKVYPGVTATDTIFYSWTGPNNFASNDTILSVTEGGLYTLVASMPSGCSCTSTIEVQERTIFNIEVQSTVAATCGKNGKLIVQIPDGAIEPITAIPIVDIDSLYAGDYSVVVTNGVGCTTLVEFTIGGVAPIEVNVDNVTDDTGSGDGTIAITTTGGATPYEYNWALNGAAVSTDEDPINLVHGDYVLSGTDANDCAFLIAPVTVSLIDAVQDIAFAKSIRLSPNPALDVVRILQDANSITNSLKVSIFGFNNQLIKSMAFSGRQIAVDVSDLPAGIYQVVIKSGDKIAVKQLLKK